MDNTTSHWDCPVQGKDLSSGEMDRDKTHLTSFDPLSPEQSDNKLFSLTTIFGLGRSYVPNENAILRSTSEASTSCAAGEKSDKAAESLVKSEGHGGTGEAIGAGTSMTGMDNSSRTPPVSTDRQLDDTRTRLSSTSQKLIPPKRTFGNVIKRLKTIGDQTKVSKQYWMPDSNCRECYDCGATFSTFKRKHHCRICGQIFCWKCCSEYVDGEFFGSKGDLRVCNYCVNVVQKYSEGKSEGGESGGSRPPSIVNEDESAVKSNLRKGKHKKATSSIASHVSDGNRLSSTSQVLNNVMINRMLCKELQGKGSGLSIKDHRDRLTTYPDSFVASELVDALVLGGKALNRRVGTAIGQGMLDARFIEHVTKEEVIFGDEYSLFRFVHEEDDANNDGEILSSSCIGRSSLKHSASDSDLLKLSVIEPHTHNWEDDIETSLSNDNLNLSIPFIELEENGEDDVVKNFHIDMLKNRKRRLKKTQEHVNNIRSALQQRNAKNSRRRRSSQENERYGFNSLDVESRADLNARSETHVKDMLEQLLKRESLPLDWKDVIFNLVVRVCENVSPNIPQGDSMDIRDYVKIKKIPGGHKRSSDYVSGVAFSKNVAHKKMAQSIIKPKILSLSFALEYQRIENQLSSFDPLVLQEREYLRILVSKIVSFKPDILVVEKTVSRIAQEMLLDAGITLLLNVKSKMMKSISRFTGAEVLTSLDKLNLTPVLGTCGSFYVSSFKGDGLQRGKRSTLVYFEGCPPNLGCTLTMRGASMEELAKVKVITKFMIHILHSCRLENAFIVDEFAVYVSDELGNVKETPKDCDSGSKPGNSKNRLFWESALQFKNSFRNACLSCTFSVKYPLPYLYCPDGINAPSREYLSDMLYWSASLVKGNFDSDTVRVDFHALKGKLLEQHFLKQKIMESSGMEKLLGKNVPLVPRKTLHKSDSSINISPQALKEQVESSSNQSENLPTTGNDSSEIATLQRQIVSKLQKEYSIDPSKLEMPDCLSPEVHQSIKILFSSHSSSAPTPCVPPRLISISYYGENDMTLGQYLDNFCFNSAFPCSDPNCSEPMTRHSRSYIHGVSRVNVGMEEFRSPIPEFKDVMLMWSWCRRCRQVTPIVPMSSETWSMSFAKFLELSFYGSSYVCRNEDCSHLLHRDHVRYFGFRQLTVHFEYDEIDLLEIVVPSRKLLRSHWEKELVLWRDDIVRLKDKFRILYNEIFDKLDFLESKLSSADGEQSDMIINGLSQLSDIKMRHSKEKVVFMEKYRQIRSRIEKILSPEKIGDLTSKLGLKIVKDTNLLKVWLKTAEKTWQDIFAKLSQELSSSSEKSKRTHRALSVPLPFSSISNTGMRKLPNIDESKSDEKEGEVQNKRVTEDRKLSVNSATSETRDIAFDPDGVPILPNPTLVRPNLGTSPEKASLSSSDEKGKRRTSSGLRRARGLTKSYSSGAISVPTGKCDLKFEQER